MKKLMQKLLPLVIILVSLLWASQYKTAEKSPVLKAALFQLQQTTLFLVTRVIDGDTIEVESPQGKEKVRYIGVDTPELHDKRPEVKELAQKASQKNEELVLRKLVKLEKDITARDRYGRLLRYVWLQDGTFVNLELVKRGYAQVVTYPPDVRYSADFLLAEQTARQKKLGLWK